MWYEIGRRAWSCCLSCELAPRSSRVGRAWVRSASRRLWMCPLGCLSAPSESLQSPTRPLSCVRRLCPGFVCAIALNRTHGRWRVRVVLPVHVFQHSGVSGPVARQSVRSASGRVGCSLSGAAVRYDRFYHLRRPSCQHLNRGNLLSCVVPASRLPVTLTATVKGS